MSRALGIAKDVQQSLLPNSASLPMVGSPRLSRLHDAGNGIHHTVEGDHLALELFVPFARQSVVTRPSLVLRLPPRALDPTLLLETVERRKKRARLHLEDLAEIITDTISSSSLSCFPH